MMDEQEKRGTQELEFILEGITTRMQMALEKMAESNKLLHSAVRWVCAVSIVIVMVLGAIIILSKAG
ncbi:MAG: hypothetical protein IJS41_01395 [Clostridia bacterium]|nr:hypothetical protein [Clostridia bacterium]